MSAHHGCNDWRERLDADASDGIDPVLGAAANDPALAEHLAACEDCRVLYGRRAALARLMRTMPRLTTPGDLEGRVVAGFHAGRREERIVFSLGRLGRRTAPENLTQRVARELSAPPVLDRLVAESLADLPRTMTHTMTRKLLRRRAPAGLAARVDERLRGPVAQRRGMRLPLSLAVAALTVVVAARLVSPGDVHAVTREPWTFEVERGAALDIEKTDPYTLELLRGLLPEAISAR